LGQCPFPCVRLCFSVLSSESRSETLNTKRILAVFFIFLGTLVAWMILGAVTHDRTDSSSYILKNEVVSLYGGDLQIESPRCYRLVEKIEEVWEEDHYVEHLKMVPQDMEVLKSHIDMDISLDRRKRGNLWFPTFQAHFTGEYLFKVDKSMEDYYLFSTLASADSIYRSINLDVNGVPQEDLLPLIRREAFSVTPDENGYVAFNISYDASGLENIYYYISSDYDAISQLNDFKLTMHTDFTDFDFPSSMMSPGKVEETDKGFDLIWDMDNAITGKDVGLVIPNKLNPGEIVTRVTFFAPIPLLFFFAVLLIVTAIMKCSFHPMHYFFLAATFFSFHLIYSYFSDHLSLYLTFGIASTVSLLLTVSYLRLFAPPKVAYFIAPGIQLVYLILFSWSFFFDGITGMILTVCSVLTLFVLMQMTGKTDWESLFAKKDPPQIQES
jgi:hypothetical protein